MRKNTPDYVKDLSRVLRKNRTNAEAILWEMLRGRKLNGFKFLRQRPIMRYIADFYCHEAKLVIELDGKHHESGETIEYDEIRTQELKSMGFTVLRFKNIDIIDNLEQVLETIKNTLN